MSPAAKAKRARTASARPTRRVAAPEDDAEHALKEIVAAMARADMAKADQAAEDSARPLQPKPAKNRQ